MLPLPGNNGKKRGAVERRKGGFQSGETTRREIGFWTTKNFDYVTAQLAAWSRDENGGSKIVCTCRKSITFLAVLFTQNLRGFVKKLTSIREQS